MTWNGMKWNGNGMKWNEMEWNGMEWNEWMSALLFLSFKWLHVPCVSREQRQISNASGGEDQLTGKIIGRLSHLRPTVDERNRPHQLMIGKSRICYSIVHISTGAGFPPSTVLTQKIWRFHPLKLGFLTPHVSLRNWQSSSARFGNYVTWTAEKGPVVLVV